MSGIVGKSGISYKKQNVKESGDSLSGIKDLVFAHKASKGQTGISFGSLNTPLEMTSNGFTQPSAQEILSANLAYKKLRVTSSLNGELMPYLTYTWTNSSIDFKNGYTASEGEIFIFELNDRVSTGHNIVDARPLIATGVLSANDDEFVVGELFKLNAYPSTQMGEVMVFVDGVIQFRNVNNATVAPAADGNYQEIEATGGYANTIKFNETEAYDRNVIVVSTNLIAERPNLSQMQYIDSLATQLDSIIPTVADLAGVPESDFQAMPNNVDLKVFGDRVKTLEQRFNELLDKLDADSGVSDTDYKSLLGI